jgi:hypothetical protein
MKKTVLTFGLISGGILAALLFGMLLFIRNIGFDKAEIVGYAGMVLAFMLVFFGIRSYRENVSGGTITFGRALAVGILIMLIASACYVIAWEIVYFNFMHDFVGQVRGPPGRAGEKFGRRGSGHSGQTAGDEKIQGAVREPVL